MHNNERLLAMLGNVELMALLARTESSGGGGAANSFVFRPGGVQGGNVFTTWASMMAAVSVTPGIREIYLDDTIAPAHVTAGTWDVEACRFLPNFEGNAELFFDPGAVFTFTTIELDGGIEFVQDAAATAPVFSLPTAQAFALITVRGQFTTANIRSAGAQPWGEAQTGTNLNLFCSDDVVIGDGTNNAFNALAGGAVLGFFNDFSRPQAHAFGGAGTASIFYSSSIGLPVTVQDATTTTLNFIGLTNAKQSTAVVDGGTHTVTFVTANIAKVATGLVQVNGDCSGATAAADTITVTLKRDGTVLRTKTIVTTAGQLNYDVAMSFLDTLPDFANHTYTLSLAGAQNNTVAANGGYIGANEQV
jgi:hypothetical protein